MKKAGQSSSGSDIEMKKRKYVAAVAVLAAAAIMIAAHDSIIDSLVKRVAVRTLKKRYDAPKILEDPGIHVILAGTGGPPILKGRSHPCTAVIANGEFLVFDAGPAAVRQLTLMGYPTSKIERIFLTHMHSDHMGGVGAMINSTWIDGRKNIIQIYGPDDSNKLTHSLYPPTSMEYETGTDDTTGGRPDRRSINELEAADFAIPDTAYIPGVSSMVEGISKAYEADTIIRASNRQIPHTNYAYALAEANPIPNMTAADDPEHRGWGELMPVYASENGKLKVFAFLVDHYPCFPSYGYRVEYAGRSVVISGDTEKNTYMAQCAKGADMLVHEALDMENTALICGIMEEHFGDPKTAAHLRGASVHHIDTLEVARVAQEASVNRLVLTHLQFPAPFRFMEKRLTEGMGAIFDGGIIAGQDGLDIYLEPIR
jgi:ribonuclease Z